ncbi:pyridoxal-phosphate dependent enzyme [Actinokineospora globicatena]|uniref:ATP-grasp domain-containing protein n=1 Tax=Actinokineospora globicatena TaxID=103729 RepID=A0A9W6QHW1_9PSEU|nr:pyridoxal-phosphate dependent enzyme [Actinokineospora globicatena]GLW90341.1 hypothetical protein Aglo03_11570 [Actinokineospora globicatena]
MLYESIIDSIGHTPLVRLRAPLSAGVELFAKLELQNLYGMKDRVARNIILDARRTGQLRPGDPVVESSSGTMALGVALVGTALGHPVHIVTDPRIDRITLGKLRALGCEVLVVEKMTANGWQSARLEALQALLTGLPRAFWPRQYSNPNNPAAYRALADEVLRELPGVDVLVGSVGSGGSLCGTARRLRETQPDLRVVGVDCVGSALFDQPDRPRRLQSGLGNSLLPHNLDRGLIDEVHWLNDHEAFLATRDLAAEQQIFAGNTSGSVYRVMCEVASRAEPGTRVVGIFPDRGDRYVDTVYDDEHWAEHGLGAVEASRTPEVVEYGTEVSRWSRSVNRAADNTPRHLLFVESNTTGTGMAALRQSGALGFRPVLLTSGPERYAGLADTGAEVVLCDTNSTVSLRQTIQDRWRREELVGVTSTSEFYIPAVAELAGWLGLPGNPPAAIRACRDKSELRAVLAGAGVRQPRFSTLTGADDDRAITEAVRAAGLPCVVKPVDDSGSNAVLLCETEEQVRAQVAAVVSVTANVRGLPMAGAALVEQYLDGPEVSVEVFSLDGAHHCVGITAKSVGWLPNFVEQGHVFPADLPPETAELILAEVTAGLDAVGWRTGASHTEVKLTPAGPAIVEINPRLAGGMIPELVRLATGVDVLGQQLLAAAARPVSLPGAPTRTAAIRFLTVSGTGVLRQVEGVERAMKVDGVVAAKVTVGVGAHVRPPRNAYERLGHVIAVGDDPDRVREALDEAVRQIELVVTADEDGGTR